MSAYPVHIDNQYNQVLNIYTYEVPSGASASNSDTLYPIYTKVGSVPANSKQDYTPTEPLVYLEFVRQSDGFPLASAVSNILGDTNVTIYQNDEAKATKALAFYKSYKANPYSPNSLDVNEIIIDNQNLVNQKDLLDKWFSDNKVGFDYSNFSSVIHWAENNGHAWVGTYYCYSPDAPKLFISLVLPKIKSGEIVFSRDGSVKYTPITGSDSNTGTPIYGKAVDLTYAKGKLTSCGASDTSGVKLQAVLQNMELHDGADGSIGLFFTGKIDGDDIIVQPYEIPKLAWWMACYDLAYTAFTGINLVMIGHTVIALAKNVPDIFNALKTGGKAVIDAVKIDISKVSDWLSEKLTSAEGDAGDLVNIDIDVDVDVDVDIDIDTDVDTDVDVDVDVDVDIDVDIDAPFVVVDIDVDIDIDIDTVVDNVIDNVVDNVVDVDTDIDTDINVDSSALLSLVKDTGRALWENKRAISKFVLKNFAVMGGMTAAQKLLELWYKKAEKDYSDEAPQQAAPLGLLMNYLENPANSINERWTTFSYYVAQGASVNQQNMMIAGVLSLKNAEEDAAQKAWRWSTNEENAAVEAMAQYSSKKDWPKAYTTLGAYHYQGKELPLKVGAAVALKFIAKIS